MSQKILLVDDNEDMRVIYRIALEHFGYEVTEAVDGESGVRKAMEIHPDLILMDVSIPVLDGWEATRILKADQHTAHVPIIALTAHAFDADRKKAQDIGCDGYLAKPIEPIRVVHEIERMLTARSA